MEVWKFGGLEVWGFGIISRRGAERQGAQRILGSCDFARGIADGWRIGGLGDFDRINRIYRIGGWNHLTQRSREAERPRGKERRGYWGVVTSREEWQMVGEASRCCIVWGSQTIHLKKMEPGNGFEPPTCSLRMSRTTSCANLAWLKNGAHYTKFAP